MSSPVVLVAAMLFPAASIAAAANSYSIVNAKIHTSNPDAPLAEAMVIRDGKLLFVGPRYGPGWSTASKGVSSQFDLGGRVVIPGIIDGHAHPGIVALGSWHAQLPYSMDASVQLSFLRDWAAEHPKPTLIFAAYYPTAMFGDSPPHKELIDAYIPDRPVIWQDFTDHAAVLNSKALQLLGIDRDTPDLKPEIVRDAKGDPTGWVKESAYEPYMPNLLARVPFPQPTVNTPETLGPMLSWMNQHGITGVLDARTSDDTLKSASELDRAGKLHMRFEAAYRIYAPAEVDKAIATLRHWQTAYATAHVGAHTVKFFIDGTNEMGTSALLEPFSNGAPAVDPAMTAQQLAAVLLKLNEAGLDMHIHMVGDRSFRTALDAVGMARKSAGAGWKVRVTFAHCELIDDADFTRVVQLGVTLMWSPHWSGGYFEGSERFLGQQRYDRMYRFQPVISLGGRVSFGSDTVSWNEWERTDPFFGMQIANTRRDIKDGVVSSEIRKPASEMLQVPDLVAGYSRSSAYQTRLDDVAGTLQAGKSADFLVLSQDLFTVPALQIRDTRPTAVVFEGRIVSGRL